MSVNSSVDVETELRSEYRSLTGSAGVLDLSSRGRLCLTGTDRARFLHGQVTNDIKRLSPGQGCYAAITNAKGKMESDVSVYCLEQELLLDFEPGLLEIVRERLERFLVADDVQIVPVVGEFGLLSVQGPRSAEVLASVLNGESLPTELFAIKKLIVEPGAEVYLSNRVRTGSPGFDLFLPASSRPCFYEKLVKAAQAIGGGACGDHALEIARIEAGIPRFGVEMTGQNLPQECGIEKSAVSYTKGCYIGQEVLNRVHTMGAVTRKLCLLGFQREAANPPLPGQKLFGDGKECGSVSSVAVSPLTDKIIGMGYVRKEWLRTGQQMSFGAEVQVGAAEIIRICG